MPPRPPAAPPLPNPFPLWGKNTASHATTLPLSRQNPPPITLTILALLVLFFHLILPLSYSQPLPTPPPSLLTAAQAAADSARILPEPLQPRVLRPAISIAILAQSARILPDSLPEPELLFLANALFDSPSSPQLLSHTLASFPPADSLLFNGRQLLGAAFARTDNLIGLDSLPLAFARSIPAILTPIPPDQISTLSAFIQSQASQLQPLRTRTQAFYNAPIAHLLYADGFFLRPYSGKLDDLYVHFVQQNTTLLSLLSFYSIAESLPARRYSPITGIGPPTVVPTPWFNVSDLLSGGALLALESFRSKQKIPTTTRNPFSNYAAKLLPYLDPSLNELTPGSYLSIPREAIRRAIREPRRFSPPPVPPLLSDPSRFFGAIYPLFEPSSRRLSRKELAAAIRQIDFETPLPDIPTNPSANEILSDSSDWVPVFSEDEIPLLTDESPQPATELEPSPEKSTPTSRSETPSRRVEPIYPKPVLPKHSPAKTTPQPTPTPRQPTQTPPPPEPPLVAALPTFPISKEKNTSSAGATQPLVPTPTPPADLTAKSDNSIQNTIEQAIKNKNEQLVETGIQPLTPVTEPAPPLLVSAEPSPIPQRIPLPSPTPPPIAYREISVPPEKPTPTEAPPPTPTLAALPAPTEPPHPKPLQLAPALTINLPTPPTLPPIDDEPLMASLQSQPPQLPRRLEPLPLPTPPQLLASATPSPIRPELPPTSVLPVPGVLSSLPQPQMESEIAAPSNFAALNVPVQSVSPTLPPLEEILPSLAAARPTPTPPPARVASAEPVALPDFSSAPYIAVITPTINACEAYTTALAQNESELSALLAQLNRTQLYLRWLNEALEPLEEYLAENPSVPESTRNQLLLAINLCTDEMALLLEVRSELLRQRQSLLAQRQALQLEIRADLQKNALYLQKNALGTLSGI